jgi:hypothetical protein
MEIDSYGAVPMDLGSDSEQAAEVEAEAGAQTKLSSLTSSRVHNVVGLKDATDGTPSDPSLHRNTNLATEVEVDLDAFRRLPVNGWAVGEVTDSGLQLGESISRDQLFLLFEILRPTWTEELPPCRPLGLRSTLHRYQRKAVAWMTWRESGERRLTPHPFWTTFHLSGGTLVSYNPVSGQLQYGPPPLAAVDFRGGILAEEMGLGKTVEVIALVLNNPAPLPAANEEVKCVSGAPSLAVTPLAAGADGSHGARRADEAMGLKEKPGEAAQQAAAASHENASAARALGHTASAARALGHADASIDSGDGGKVRATDGSSGRIDAPADNKRRRLYVLNDAKVVFEGEVQKKARLNPSIADSVVSPTGELPFVRGTLIVSPMTIVGQWESEIKKHAVGLSVYVYDRRKHCRKQNVISATELAKYDIVLTTYNVLQEEVNFSKSFNYSLRQAKKHEIPRTPLLELKWHRVILDEAQMVKVRFIPLKWIDLNEAMI